VEFRFGCVATQTRTGSGVIPVRSGHSAAIFFPETRELSRQVSASLEMRFFTKRLAVCSRAGKAMAEMCQRQWPISASWLAFD
jgi:hypothetical protein